MSDLGPMRRYRGLTWVGWLNYLLLRWFFIRLTYTVESDDTISKRGLIVGVWPIPWGKVKRIGR